MPDIFISYSRKDSEQAQLLTELLASAGLSVWLDQSALNAASSWSKEIVQAINECRVFVVLLSPSSLESHNVIKEVSLASEKRKKILPLDLEPVVLTEDFEYQLAGIQRAPMTNIDSIIRALSKLGLEATGAPQAPKIAKESKGKKSLMILPFDDLSPTGDNAWFADGLASELISALSNIKALRLIDWNTSREFKKNRVRTTTLANEFSVRYFIEGQVRKFGDQIKISVTLLDIETGDHLWQDSLRGTMNDIFDIQEQVAAKAVEGLKLHLTTEEKQKLAKRGTENAEAYELYLKGVEYYRRLTKNDLERALALYEEAVRLDPSYAMAHASISITFTQLYRSYDRTPALLDRAAEAAEKVREIEGETAQYFWVMSIVTGNRRDANEALRLAKRSVEADPKALGGYDALGFAHWALGNREEAVKACAERVHLQENDLIAHFNLIVALSELGDTRGLRQAAERALPIFERHVRLAPDNYHARVALANVYRFAARESDALRIAEELSKIESLEALGQYNLACLFLSCAEPERGMEHLRLAVKRGFRSIEDFRRDHDLAPLRDPASPYHAEFEALLKELGEVNA